jgi:hypothetical protein
MTLRCTQRVRDRLHLPHALPDPPPSSNLRTALAPLLTSLGVPSEVIARELAARYPQEVARELLDA